LKCAATEKLRIDFLSNSSIHPCMDENLASPDLRELIAHLCLEAGRIMEDTSCELALALPTDASAVDTRLGMVRVAADDIQFLIAAAQVLQRRRSDQT